MSEHENKFWTVSAVLRQVYPHRAVLTYSEGLALRLLAARWPILFANASRRDETAERWGILCVAHAIGYDDRHALLAKYKRGDQSDTMHEVKP